MIKKAVVPKTQTFHIAMERRRFLRSMAVASAGFSLPDFESSGAQPFSLSQAGTVNTNKITRASNGTLDVFLEEKSVKGFYYISFRVPGANTGTP
jgi:hypothetical protein